MQQKPSPACACPPRLRLPLPPAGQVYVTEPTGEVDTKRYLGPADTNESIAKLPEGKKVGGGMNACLLPAAWCLVLPP